MAHWDLLLTDAQIATMKPDGSGFGIVQDNALAIADGRIAWTGSSKDCPARQISRIRSLDNRWVTPALIDCHTHLVFGGSRADEFEQRLAGVSYAEIAQAGGGIASTVRATREASIDQLVHSAMRRARQLASSGVATIEIKSGYGLSVESELKMLRAAREIGHRTGLSVVTTLLAAHAIPPEFKGQADQYIEMICDELLPQVHELELADAVDGYCESIAFDEHQLAKLFSASAELNLPVKLHADQLSNGHGAALAARYGALSADHLEYSDEAGIHAMAKAGTCGVLLPGAYLTLSETQKPPVDLMRKAGVPIALATDCNPGTSALCSVTQAMGLGSRLFGLTPAECLAGVTRVAAQALGLAEDRGTLETGKRADIAVWDIDHPRDLTYWMGTSPLHELMIGGRLFPFDQANAQVN